MIQFMVYMNSFLLKSGVSTIVSDIYLEIEFTQNLLTFMFNTVTTYLFVCQKIL